MKKIVFLSLIILLILIGAGGFFWWQKSQKDIKELNKNLPEGVRVVKSFFSNGCKVVNKIDGYEFKVPKEWERLGDIRYYEIPKNGNRLTIESPPAFISELIALDTYKEDVKELKPWVIDLYRSQLGIEGELTGYEIQEEELESLKIIKLKEASPTISISYFFQNKDKSITYEIRSEIWVEESIREIIVNGKWWDRDRTIIH